MSTRTTPPGGQAGHLVVIGGAERKLGRAVVLRRFVSLAGGRAARVVIVPTASSIEADVVSTYTQVFTRLGAAEVTSVRPTSRADADDAGTAAAMDRATGVFLTGGNQLRLSQVVAGTALGAAIHAANARGAAVAGTSAGAGVLSEHMLSLGEPGVTPRQRASMLSAGLGLLRGVVVDQHFDQRSRYGRLMATVAASPQLLGIGVDEDTAAVVGADRVLDVVGAGAVFVVDGSHAVTDAHEARRGAPLLVSGAVVHVLPAGARFHLDTRALVGYEQHHLDAALRAVSGERTPTRQKEA